MCKRLLWRRVNKRSSKSLWSTSWDRAGDVHRPETHRSCSQCLGLAPMINYLSGCWWWLFLRKGKVLNSNSTSFTFFTAHTCTFTKIALFRQSVVCSEMLNPNKEGTKSETSNRQIRSTVLSFSSLQLSCFCGNIAPCCESSCIFLYFSCKFHVLCVLSCVLILYVHCLWPMLPFHLQPELGILSQLVDRSL